MSNKKSKWISVERRLPDDEPLRVLVFLADEEFTKPIGDNKIDTDRFVDGKWVRWGRYVTHWMPLPEAPPQPKVKKVKEPKLPKVKEPKLSNVKKAKEPKPPQYKRLIEEHRCIRCKEPLLEGYTKTRCPECIKKDNAYAKEYYKGKCRMCCRELPPDYKYLICKKCRIKRSQERYEKKQIDVITNKNIKSNNFEGKSNKQRKEDENAVGQRSFEKC